MVDLNEMMRRELESMVNQIMDWQADELCGEGNRRNGYRERKLATVLGEITMRIPKLREGTLFPRRADQALFPRRPRDGRGRGETRARPLDLQDREAADALGFAGLSPRASRA